MPIYEYQCSACGYLHEALQKVADAPLVDCPACGESALKKKVSAAAFRLKGGGWYETDFKSGNKKNLAGDDGGANKGSAEGAKGDGGKGDGGGAGAGDGQSGKSSGEGGAGNSKSAADKKGGDSSAA